MPLTLIKGEYVVAGGSPDGDSVRFYPSGRDAWRRAGLPVRANARGGAQLRLDGVDALETHYAPRSGDVVVRHQPRLLAEGAADYLLRRLGFTSVQRDGSGTVTDSIPDRTPGYVLTRSADPYGRCVAFAFAGSTDDPDLRPRWLDPEGLEETANHALLAAGLAYPTYYSKLYADLRATLTATVAQSRATDEGIWKADVTNDGFEVGSLTDLTEHLVILPKLFRRLVDYLAISDGETSPARFTEYLAARGDRVLVLSEGRTTGFDNVVEVAGRRVRLRYPPEDLVFSEADGGEGGRPLR